MFAQRISNKKKTFDTRLFKRNEFLIEFVENSIFSNQLNRDQQNYHSPAVKILRIIFSSKNSFYHGNKFICSRKIWIVQKLWIYKKLESSFEMKHSWKRVENFIKINSSTNILNTNFPRFFYNYIYDQKKTIRYDAHIFSLCHSNYICEWICYCFFVVVQIAFNFHIRSNCLNFIRLYLKRITFSITNFSVPMFLFMIYSLGEEWTPKLKLNIWA